MDSKLCLDKTWIHHCTPESNEQRAEWLEADQSRPKRPKMQASSGKVMASIVWHAQGVIFIDYLEKGKTIKGSGSSKYHAALLDRLNDEIKKKLPHLAKVKVLFHQDNGPAHKLMVATAKLH